MSFLLHLLCLCYRLCCSYSILWGTHECRHPRADVPVLRSCLVWAEDPEVSVVEEVPHHYPDGMRCVVCRILLTRIRSQTSNLL